MKFSCNLCNSPISTADGYVNSHLKLMQCQDNVVVKSVSLSTNQCLYLKDEEISDINSKSGCKTNIGQCPLRKFFQALIWYKKVSHYVVIIVCLVFTELEAIRQ